MQISYKNEITYTVVFTEMEFNHLTDAIAEWSDSTPKADLSENQKEAGILCRDMWTQKQKTQSS